MDCAKLFVFMARSRGGSAGDVVGCIERKNGRDIGIVCRDNARKVAGMTVLVAIVDFERSFCALQVSGNS
jgi:hypothetical protein